MQDAELFEICTLPAAYPDSGLSWNALVDRSPYGRNAEGVTEERLTSFLKAHPELVEHWLQWSEDKRCTPSPFFRRAGARYELGYMEQGGRLKSSSFFAQPARPCARFILQELAD